MSSAVRLPLHFINARSTTIGEARFLVEVLTVCKSEISAGLSGDQAGDVDINGTTAARTEQGSSAAASRNSLILTEPFGTKKALLTSAKTSIVHRT